MTQENTTPIYWNAQQLHPDVVAVFSSSLPLATATSQTPSAILLPQQTHTVNATWVTPDLRPEYISLEPSPLFPDTDALITDMPGLTIGVRTADCVPILLYAADIKAVAAIHAGWKGTLHGIVDNVIDQLTARGSHPSKIHACFGPSICPQCYEVDPSLAQQFIDAGIDVINTGTVCPFSSRAEELADNQFAKAAKFEKDGDMSKANIWVCSQEYADSVAFGFADEVDYVSFTKKANTSLYVENWSNVDGVCLEIYDKKENLLASYTGDDLIYVMIELNGIKNGTACVMKITVDDDSFYAGRIYQISM